jgi:2-phospho-L-lactate guanylyltransferase
VILPAKTFAQGKSRLRTHLSDPARSALARELFQRALHVSLRCPGVSNTYVVTNGDDVAELVRATDLQERAEVFRDPEPNGSLATLMDWALTQATTRRATRALILMADLPTVEPCDLEAVFAALDHHDAVLVPDRRGQSTNALGLRLPFRGRTAFGHADSLARHRAQARALGLRTGFLENERIAHDVDVAEDLLPDAGITATDVPGSPGNVAGKREGW